MIGNRLPANWDEWMLGDVGEWIGGGTPSKSEAHYWNGSIPWVSPKDMKVSSIVDTEDHISEDAIENSAAKIIPCGAVLFVTRSGILAHSFPVATTKTMVTVNQDLKAIVPTPVLDAEYLAWCMRTSSREILDRCTKDGTTVHSIEIPSLKTFSVPVPPLNEQRRIVAKIEALFSELDKGVESLKTAREQLKVYRQTVLKHAFEGKLTAQWREENKDKLESPEQLLARIQKEREACYKQQLVDWKAALKEWEAKGREGKKPGKPLKPKKLSALSAAEKTFLGDLPEGWAWTKIGAIASVGTGVTPLKSNTKYYDRGDIAWVTSGALNDPFVREPSDYVTIKALNETNLRLYQPHTLLVALYGEGKTRGKCSELLIEATTNQAIAAVVQEGISSKFIGFFKWFLTKNYEAMRLGASGGVQPNLNLGIIESMAVPICSVSEAREVASTLDAEFSTIEQFDDDIASQLEKCETLRQSILKKAFSGQLVPQDPNDEPASVLLERIKAEKARQIGSKSAKTGTRKTRSVRKEVN